MNSKTHWIAMRVLGLLLACLCAVIWKIPASLWSPHAFAVVPVSPPNFDPQVGPANLPTEISPRMGPAEFADIAIDLGLSWRTVPEKSRNSWLEWLALCSRNWGAAETLGIFSSVAGERLSQAERMRIAKGLEEIQANPPEPPFSYVIDRIVGLDEYLRDQTLKRIFWVGAPILFTLLVVAHHIRISRARARMLNRLGIGPNPPLNSDPTATVC